MLLAFVGFMTTRSENADLRRQLRQRVRLTQADFAMAAMFLTSQYTGHRARTGSWPRPGEIRKDLPLLESRYEDQADKPRVDIYQASTPGVTIQFRLGRGGDMSIRVVEVPVARWRGAAKTLIEEEPNGK